MYIRFVDIGEIDDRHGLKLLFIITVITAKENCSQHVNLRLPVLSYLPYQLSIRYS
jgi:hypothetical protein